MIFSANVVLISRIDSCFANEVTLLVRAPSWRAANERIELLGAELAKQDFDRLDGEEESGAIFEGIRKTVELESPSLENSTLDWTEIAYSRMEFNQEGDVERWLDGDLVRVMLDR